VYVNAGHVTVMSQLPREADKFVIAHVLLFKHVNFWQY